MSTSFRTVLLVCTLSCAATALRAQTFEGIIREHAVSVGPVALARLAGSAESPDTAKLFAIAIDSLFALAQPGMPDGQIRSMGTTTTYIKGNRFRIDGGSPVTMVGGSYMVIDKGAGTMTQVMPSARQAMVMTVGGLDEVAGKAVGAMLENARKNAAPDTTPQIRRLPKTREIGKRTIRGFATKGYETLVDENRTITWAAPELMDAKRITDFDMTGMMRSMGMPQSMGPPKEPERGLTLLELRLSRVPRMLAVMMGSGYSYNVSEVLSVERGPVADSVFAIPADYSRIDMNAMMSSMPKPPAPKP